MKTRLLVHFFAYGYPVAPSYLLKRLVLHLIAFEPLSKISWKCGFISGFLILFHWSVYLSLYQYQPYSLAYCIQLVLKLSRVLPLTLFFFLKIAILIPLPFQINFSLIFSVSIKILLEFWQEFLSTEGEWTFLLCWVF